MQLLGTDPVNPDAKALQKNMNPQALIKFAHSKIIGVKTQLAYILASAPTNSQVAFFAKWFPSYVNDCIWALETIDAVIGPENYRGAFRADAALIDANLDVIYEDMAKASKVYIAGNSSAAQAASSSFAQWNAAKMSRPAGSAVVSVNESKILAGTMPDTFAASRDIKKVGILTTQELAERSTTLRKLAPGVKPAETTLQYATGGGGVKSTGILNPMETGADVPTAPKKPINPLVLAGVAVAGYFAYKSLA